MKRALVVVGLILVGAGVGFALQSLGQLGPPSSFMYQNPDWTRYGFVIGLAGAAITAIGIGLR
jgi:hypothetical protein